MAYEATWHANLKVRPRRLRLSQNMRRLVRETGLSPDDFIYPLFARHGQGVKLPVESLPGIYQLSVDNLAAEVREIAALGIPAVILFGIPEQKDWRGSDNFAEDGIVPRAIRAIKDTDPDLLVISDMCFCQYTHHGHCGIINTPDNPHYDPALPRGYLHNDHTLDLLQQASLAHAGAGADIIAPSGMIDGAVAAIRSALDNGSAQHVSIMSYIKYASAFYGPFRDAAESAPQFGDRRQYQLDPGNQRQAFKEIALDIEEGADIIMIKPALPNLDALSHLRRNHTVPAAAYQVSGEYAMIQAAAQRGWLDLERVALESLTCIKRAGADMIISYFAKEALKWLGA
ncbi:MAG: porphobilinogen synthase [Chloroflexota bacterium]|nr:porphobilinogen synthase [Chloroflexota bacterium]